MIMCVLLCYPVSIHMSQLLSTGRPISSLYGWFKLGSINYRIHTTTFLCVVTHSTQFTVDKDFHLFNLLKVFHIT